MAQLLSVIGDQFARVALTVLVYARTESASLTALTYALTLLPSIVSGPLLSGLADRYPRRQVMVLADVTRAGLVVIMAVPTMPLPWLCGLLVLVQFLAAPFTAARAATLPEVLNGDQYRLAVSLSNMTYQAALLIGFASGGVLVAGVSPSGALLLDAATFLGSAALVRWRVQDRPLPAGATPGSQAGASWAHTLSAGARLVSTDPQLRMWVWLLCMCAFPVVVEGLAVPYAVTIDAGPAGVGLLLAAPPAGSLLGMLLLNRLPPTVRLHALWPLAVVSSAVLVFCAAGPGLVPTIMLWTVSGAATSYVVVANGEYVRAVPAHQRGQAVGLASTAMRVAQGAAVLTAGLIADTANPPAVVAIAGGAGVLITACGWVLARRSAAVRTPADRH